MDLFAYGTLLVPRIWRAVTGVDCASEPATLPGYAIYRVEGADFPGIIESAAIDSVPGRIFSGLDDRTIARLDAYEDDFYERREISLLGHSGASLQAHAYIVPERHRQFLSAETWSLDWFNQSALETYLDRHGF